VLSSLEYNYGVEVKEFDNLLIGSTVCGEQYFACDQNQPDVSKVVSDHLRLSVCLLNR